MDFQLFRMFWSHLLSQSLIWMSKLLQNYTVGNRLGMQDVHQLAVFIAKHTDKKLVMFLQRWGGTEGPCTVV